MVAEARRKDFEKRCDTLRRYLNDADFLANKGLGNEAGIFIFCYDPVLELEARAFFKLIVKESEQGRLGVDGVRANVVERNLYDTLLGIAQTKRILDKLPQQEAKRGQSGLLKQIQRIATPEAYVAAMDWNEHSPGDVLLLTGVGEIYPFMRTHDILNNMQSTFRDVPVVVAYPGAYDGGSFSLFGKLKDGNYYRAFDLI